MTGRVLRSKIDDGEIAIDEILTSPLSRTRDTAEEIAKMTGVPMRVEERLMEQNFGKWESTPRDGQDFRLAKENFIDRYDGGESMLRVAQRIYNLIQKISVLDNVALPMMYAGTGRRERLQRAEMLLDLVGMKDRMKHKPAELSGGQMQRVAIARAMANDPDIILADEPTGALDSKTGVLVMDIFHRLNREQGKTIVLITHNNELAGETDRIYAMSDGQFTSVREGSVVPDKDYPAREKTENAAAEGSGEEVQL